MVVNILREVEYGGRLNRKKGWFHGWFQWAENSEFGPVALVEDAKTGQVWRVFGHGDEDTEIRFTGKLKSLKEV